MFSHRLRARSDPGRAAAQTSRWSERPRRRHRRLHGQVPYRPAVADPGRAQSGRSRASTCRRRRSWTSTEQFSMCINCMLCYWPAPSTASTRTSSARRRSHSPSATTSTRAMKVPTSATEVPDRRRRASRACTFVGECSAACPKGVDPVGAIQRYKLTAATQAVKDLLMPRGGDECLPATGPLVLVAGAPLVSALRFPRGEQRLYRRGPWCTCCSWSRR